MKITDRASLEAAITEYLARDQDTTLIARIPTFIQLLESKVNRNLFHRKMELRATALTDPEASEPEFIALPADFQSMRRIRLTNVGGKPLLEFKSNSQMDLYRSETADVPGQPRYFTIFGDELELAPTPARIYTVEMVYRQNVALADASDATNWLLTLAPDIYLYGSLLEAAPYINQDGRIATWGSGFASALKELNDLGTVSAFNAGPLTVRVAGRVF